MDDDQPERLGLWYRFFLYSRLVPISVRLVREDGLANMGWGHVVEMDGNYFCMFPHNWRSSSSAG